MLRNIKLTVRHETGNPWIYTGRVEIPPETPNPLTFARLAFAEKLPHLAGILFPTGPVDVGCTLEFID